MIDAHCRRGGKALVLEPSDRGEMIVVKHGRREMQLAWTHLLPATFGGRARMNVQNSLAAAAAAFAAGAPLHDIRQGLRTFSTSYYLSPGRLNEVEVNGVQVIVDYCHNAPGMRMLGDFVDRVGESLATTSELGRPSRIGVIATAGDRRDDDMRELGAVAAQHFDVVVVREDVSLRGRKRGETAELVAEGVRAAAMAEGARCKQLEIDPRRDRGASGTPCRAPTPATWSCVCVDKHPTVMAELENWSNQAQAGSGTTDGPVGDPDFTPGGGTRAAVAGWRGRGDACPGSLRASAPPAGGVRRPAAVGTWSCSASTPSPAAATASACGRGGSRWTTSGC